MDSEQPEMSASPAQQSEMILTKYDHDGETLVEMSEDEHNMEQQMEQHMDQHMEEHVLGYLEVQPSQLQAVQEGGTIYFQSDGLELDEHLILAQGEEGGEIIVVVRTDEDGSGLTGEVNEATLRSLKLGDLSGLSHHLTREINEKGEEMTTYVTYQTTDSVMEHMQVDEEGGLISHVTTEGEELGEHQGETVTYEISENDANMINAMAAQSELDIQQPEGISEPVLLMEENHTDDSTVAVEETATVTTESYENGQCEQLVFQSNIFPQESSQIQSESGEKYEQLEQHDGISGENKSNEDVDTQAQQYETIIFEENQTEEPVETEYVMVEEINHSHQEQQAATSQTTTELRQTAEEIAELHRATDEMAELRRQTALEIAELRQSNIERVQLHTPTETTELHPTLHDKTAELRQPTVELTELQQTVGDETTELRQPTVEGTGPGDETTELLHPSVEVTDFGKPINESVENWVKSMEKFNQPEEEAQIKTNIVVESAETVQNTQPEEAMELCIVSESGSLLVNSSNEALTNYSIQIENGLSSSPTIDSVVPSVINSSASTAVVNDAKTLRTTPLRIHTYERSKNILKNTPPQPSSPTKDLLGLTPKIKKAFQKIVSPDKKSTFPVHEKLILPRPVKQQVVQVCLSSIKAKMTNKLQGEEEKSVTTTTKPTQKLELKNKEKEKTVTVKAPQRSLLLPEATRNVRTTKGKSKSSLDEAKNTEDLRVKIPTKQYTRTYSRVKKLTQPEVLSPNSSINSIDTSPIKEPVETMVTIEPVQVNIESDPSKDETDPIATSKEETNPINSKDGTDRTTTSTGKDETTSETEKTDVILVVIPDEPIPEAEVVDQIPLPPPLIEQTADVPNLEEQKSNNPVEELKTNRVEESKDELIEIAPASNDFDSKKVDALVEIVEEIATENSESVCVKIDVVVENQEQISEVQVEEPKPVEETTVDDTPNEVAEAEPKDVSKNTEEPKLPEVSDSVLEVAESIPEVSEPIPESSEPIQESSEPIPDESEPIPEESEPIQEDEEDPLDKEIREEIENAIKEGDNTTQSSIQSQDDSKAESSSRKKRIVTKRKLFTEELPPSATKKQKISDKPKEKSKGKQPKAAKNTQSQDELFDELLRTSVDTEKGKAKKRKKDDSSASKAVTFKKRRSIPARLVRNDSSDEDEVVLSNLRHYPESPLKNIDSKKRRGRGKAAAKPAKESSTDDEIIITNRALIDKAMSEPTMKKKRGKAKSVTPPIDDKPIVVELEVIEDISPGIIAVVTPVDTPIIEQVKKPRGRGAKVSSQSNKPVHKSLSEPTRSKSSASRSKNGLFTPANKDFQIHIRPQSPTPEKSTPTMTCKECHFKTTRMDNLIAHYKTCREELFPFKSQTVGEKTPTRFSLDPAKSRGNTPQSKLFLKSPGSSKKSSPKKRKLVSTNNSDKDENSQQSQEEERSSDMDSDESNGSFDLEMKNSFGFSEDDVVWALYRGQHWPALVKKMYPKTKKVSIVFIDTPMPKTTFKMNVSKITNFDDASKNKEFLGEGCSQPNNDNLVKAVQRAEDYLRKRCLGLKISATNFFNNPEDVRQYLTELEEEEQEKKDQLLDSSLMDYNEMIHDPNLKTTTDETEVTLTEKTRNVQIRPDNLVKLITEGTTDDHLMGVYNGNVNSERHQLFTSSEESQRNKLKRTPFFEIINNEPLQTQVVQYCLDLFKKNIKADESFQCVGYAFEVWAAEALVKAISMDNNVELKDSEAYFTKELEHSKSPIPTYVEENQNPESKMGTSEEVRIEPTEEENLAR